MWHNPEKNSGKNNRNFHLMATQVNEGILSEFLIVSHLLVDEKTKKISIWPAPSKSSEMNTYLKDNRQKLAVVRQACAEVHHLPNNRYVYSLFCQ